MDPHARTERRLTALLQLRMYELILLRTISDSEFCGLAKNARDGAMISTRFRAEAPENVAGLGREVNRCFPFSTVATAAPAYGFATAVVVGDQVIPVIGRIVAGTYPGDRG